MRWSKVQHYYLDVNAMTQPMRLREEQSGYTVRCKRVSNSLSTSYARQSERVANSLYKLAQAVRLCLMQSELPTRSAQAMPGKASELPTRSTNWPRPCACA